MTRSIILLLLAASLASPATLFDGKTFRNFRTPTGTTGPEVSWRIVNGTIESMPEAGRQCDLWTAAEYDNFDLRFDWKVGPHGNSGIKYLIQASAVDRVTSGGHSFLHETSLGYEFQLAAADPSNTTLTKGSTGALYNYLAPAELAARPTGEWNSGRLVVNGRLVEHWINGRRVLAYSLDSPELKAALRAKHLHSSQMMDELKLRKTSIAFQLHDSPVAFRKIRIVTH